MSIHRWPTIWLLLYLFLMACAWLNGCARPVQAQGFEFEIIPDDTQLRFELQLGEDRRKRCPIDYGLFPTVNPRFGCLTRI